LSTSRKFTDHFIFHADPGPAPYHVHWDYVDESASEILSRAHRALRAISTRKVERRSLFPPDPVAFFRHLTSIELPLRRIATVIDFIPADGVKHVATVLTDPIMQRLAVDDITRHFRNELCAEILEPVGKSSVSPTVPFQGTGKGGKISAGLGKGALSQGTG